jgi:hypothetical protein
MSHGDLDAALDELYGADPAEFVAARKQLSAALRTAGDKDGAKQLLAARRPSTSAWALNQVARREPQLVETLLDASRALYAAQTRGSNKPDVLRDAIRTHREAVDATADAALTVLGARANDKFRSEIVSTLRAVSVDEEAEEQLRTGRVVREASASGFPDSTGLTLVPDLPASKTPPKAKAKGTGKSAEPAKPAKKQRQGAEPAHAAARAEREREEQRRAALARKEAAHKEADAAEADAAAAQARVDELQNDLDAARRELMKARSRSRTAKSKLRDLR